MGNLDKATKVTTELSDALKAPFTLCMRPFVGVESVMKFNVNIRFDATSTQVNCWLESVELEEKIAEATEKMLLERVRIIRESHNLPVMFV